GETTATPPPSAYRVTARISVRPHIPIPFPSESERNRFTTPTGRYEVGESSAAARQIRPALTVDDSRRAEDRLIGRPRRERRYFRTLSWTTATINNLIAQRVTEALTEYETQRNSVVNGDTSHTTGTGPRTVRPTWECTYKDYLNYGPLKFKGTEGVIGLTQWGEVKKLEVELWNLKVKGTDIASYTLRFQELALLYRRMFPEESDEIERYVGGLPEMIQGNVMSYKPKSMQKAIEFANNQLD
nr:reverse transcriptase domain-containing protein [Tanacetum cinerariifolium]